MRSSRAKDGESFETLALEVQGEIARVTLCRAEHANSRNQTMRNELMSLYAHLADDSDVKVVVLTGEGDRFFCAGMDMKEASVSESPLERRDRLRSSRDIESLARLPQVTIAAINGYALGGGCEMALACDIRVATTDASIGLPEIRHGLMPGGGGTQRLPRLIGFALASELIYTGRLLSGTEAEDVGLVNRVVPSVEALHAEVAELAHSIARHPATALRASKDALVAGFELPLSAGVERELDGLLFLLAERDARA